MSTSRRNKARHKPGFVLVLQEATSASAVGQPARLALAELLAATGLVEADLLALDFAGITRYQACLRQGGLERGVVVDKGAGNAVANCTGLTRLATAANVGFEVERFEVLGDIEGLTHDHAAGLARDVLVVGLVVHDGLSRSFFSVYTRH